MNNKTATNTNKTPKVAIIMRTKDRLFLLERALKSVANQTSNDYTLVIINDGGDAVQLEKLVNKHAKSMGGQVKIIHNSTPTGMQAAANKGIKASKSKYVVVHDDDDSWDPKFLEKTTEHLELTDAMGVVSTTNIIQEEIVDNKIKIIENTRLFPNLKFINFYKMCLENYAAPISFIFRRDVFEKIGYFDNSLAGYGDWDFGLRFLTYYDIDFMNTPQPLAYYHQRPQIKGNNQNSVFSDDQLRLENLMFNKHLRQDLQTGKFGLGFIINFLRSDFNNNQSTINSINSHAEKTYLDLAHIIETVHNDLIARQSNSPNKPNKSLLKTIPRKTISRTKKIFKGQA